VCCDDDTGRRNGVYPLTAFSTAVRAPTANHITRANTPELVENDNKKETPEPVEVEGRLVIRHSCQIHQLENSQTLQVHFSLLRSRDVVLVSTSQSRGGLKTC